MTLTATTNKVAYAGNGSTTSFAVTFIYWDDTDVRVILSNDSTGAETVWTDGTQYNLTGGSGATGTLTIDTSPTDYTPASGETLTIKSNLPDTQSTSLPLGGSLPSTSIEERLDKSVRLVQQLDEELDRAILFPESSTATNISLPNPSALEMLRWNSGAAALENVTLTDLSLGLGTATKWTFDTSTSMADPGTGDVRFNHATLASVTQISVSYKSSQSGNPDISDWVAAWDDSTNDAIRGHIMIHEDGTPSNFWTGYINGAITDNSTWLQIPVTHVDSSGSFSASDNMVVGFSRAGDAGAGGFDMLWDADTSDSDSGAGKVWFNNGTLASVSIVYIDDLDSNGVSINALVDTFDDSTTTALRGTLKITKKGTPATYAVYNVNGAVTSASTYSKVAVAHVISNGTFTDGDPAYMEFFRTGNIGIGGLSMAWETTTTDTDQGAGKCWANNGTLSSATVFYMDDVDSNSADVNAFVDTWDDSTNLALRGTIIVRELASPANFVIFSVTGAVTSASTYSKIAVTHVATGGSMTDGNAMSVEFTRAGDRGPNAGLDMTFDNTTTDSDQGAGKLWLNNGTVASASVVYLDDVDDNSVSINSFVDSFDDSSSSVKGHIQFEKQFDPAVFAMFNVTGSVTSASTYSKVACTYVTGAGSFSDGDKISTTFIRGGDKGDTGARGSDAGLDMTFESTTTDTDQGVGKVWFNNGTLASATVMYMDDVDANSASINSYMDSWDDSTNTALRGTVTITQKASAAIFAIYNVTGAVTSASTYSKVAVTYVTGAGSFTDADASTVSFVRTGNAGAITNIVEDTSPQLGGDLDCNAAQIQWSKGADVASDTALAVLTDGNYFDVTGTTTITSINTTGGAGTQIKLHFDGALTLTHDSTDLVLPGGANITTAANDEAEFIEYASGDYRCTSYTKATGGPVLIVNNSIDETKLKDALVADFTEVTVATGDSILFGDATDSGNTKRDTVQGVLDLAATASTAANVGLQTIWVPAAAMSPTASNPCADIASVETTSGRPDMRVLDFDDGSDEHAQFQIAFPKSWNEGTITFQVYWCSTAADTDGVSWGLQGVSVPDNSTIDVAYGTAIVVDDVNQGAAEEMLVSPTSSAVTIAGAAVDTVTFFRIFRDVSDANDTAAEDARLLGVKLFFTTDAENDD